MRINKRETQMTIVRNKLTITSTDIIDIKKDTRDFIFNFMPLKLKS